MKYVNGFWLPDSEIHLVDYVKNSPSFAGGPTYQFKKFAACFPLIRSFDIAIDIGAHCGLWSRVLGRCFGEVWAFEPLPVNIECFKRNVTEKHVVLTECAIGDGSIDVVTMLQKQNTAQSHVVSDPKYGIQVDCTSIDAFGLSSASFIKVDVEGFEVPVIVGAENLIKQSRPVIILEQKPNNAERHGFAQYQARDMLLKWGMSQKYNLGDDVVMVWP